MTRSRTRTRSPVTEAVAAHGGAAAARPGRAARARRHRGRAAVAAVAGQHGARAGRLGRAAAPVHPPGHRQCRAAGRLRHRLARLGELHPVPAAADPRAAARSTGARLPGLQISQRAAAALVGSLLVLLPTSTALAATCRSRTRTVASASAATQSAGGSHQAAVASADAAAAGQTASDRDHLHRPRHAPGRKSLVDRGTPLRQRRVVHPPRRRNEGRPMADGSIFRADAPIRRLDPAAAVGIPRHDTASSADNAEGGPSRRPRRPGPQLISSHPPRPSPRSPIRRRVTRRTGRSWLCRQPRPQPDGLPRITDASLIRPGQHITIRPHPRRRPRRPAGDQHERQPDSEERGKQPDRSGAGAEQDGSDTARDPERGSDTDARGSRSPDIDSVRNAQPARRPRLRGLGVPRAQGLFGPPPDEQARRRLPPPRAIGIGIRLRALTATAPPRRDRPVQESSSVSLQQGAGVGAVLAAALTGTLAWRRLRQRRSRKPGADPSRHRASGGQRSESCGRAARGGADGIQRLQAALAALASRARALRRRCGARVSPPTECAEFCPTRSPPSRPAVALCRGRGGGTCPTTSHCPLYLRRQTASPARWSP